MSDGTEQQFLIVRIQSEDKFLPSSSKGEVNYDLVEQELMEIFGKHVFFVNSTRRGRRNWRWVWSVEF